MVRQRSLHKIARRRQETTRRADKEAILEAGAAALRRTYMNGRTALHEAARVGHGSHVACLLRRAGEVLTAEEFARLVNARDVFGCSPLLYAAASMRLVDCQARYVSCLAAIRQLAAVPATDVWALQPRNLAVGSDRHCGFGQTALGKLARALRDVPWFRTMGLCVYNFRFDERLVRAQLALIRPVGGGEKTSREGHPLLAHDPASDAHYRALTMIVELDNPRVAGALWRSVPALRGPIRNVVLNHGLPKTIRHLAWMDVPELRAFREWQLDRHRHGRCRTRCGKDNVTMLLTNGDALRPWTARAHRAFPLEFRRGAETLLLAFARASGSPAPGRFVGGALRSVMSDHFTATRSERGYPFAAFTDRGRDTHIPAI